MLALDFVRIRLFRAKSRWVDYLWLYIREHTVVGGHNLDVAEV